MNYPGDTSISNPAGWKNGKLVRDKRKRRKRNKAGRRARRQQRRQR